MSDKAHKTDTGSPDGGLDPAIHLLAGYVDRHTLASQLNIHVRTLDRWHLEQVGPPRTTIGKQVLYRGEAVKAWLLEQESTSPSMRRERRMPCNRLQKGRVR